MWNRRDLKKIEFKLLTKYVPINLDGDKYRTRNIDKVWTENQNHMKIHRVCSLRGQFYKWNG